MKDRVPVNPGRVLITPENGSSPFYATMARADNPTQEGDPLNKNTLLRDTTAALFGKGADALPDQILSVLSKAALWKQLGHDPIYTPVTIKLSEKSEGETVKILVDGQFEEFYVAKKNYESGLNGSGRTLLISSKNTENTVFGTNQFYPNSNVDTILEGSYKSKFPSEFQTAMGKTKIQVKLSRNATSTSTIERSIFSLSASEFGFSSSTSIADGEKIDVAVSTIKSKIGVTWTRTPSDDTEVYVWCFGSSGWDTAGYSSSRNILPAFTLPDSFSYTIYQDSAGNYHAEQAYTDSIHELTDVLGNGLNTPRIETGSYAGAGAAGSSNPNKLTFQSPPKFVVVQDVSDSPSYDMIFLINGVKRVFTGTDTSLSYALYVTWNGNEVSWYATQYHDNQMNQSGHTYNYIAIL